MAKSRKVSRPRSTTRSRKTKKKSSNLSIFFVVCVVLVLLGAFKQNREASSELKRNIETSLQALSEQDMTLPTSGYSLEILSPAGIKLDDQKINKMLRNTGDRAGMFTYQGGGVGTYTSSAQATDHRQHLVNTFLEGFQPFEVENVMMPLYVLAKRKSYEYDNIQYAGRPDVWQSSRQAFFYPRGDCEDHAIVLADWLIEMGEDARVATGLLDGGGHAWVILFKNGKEFLLEATQKYGLSRNKAYPLAALHREYNPQYMFNREYFWENTGSKFTTSYSGKNWQKKSRLSYKPEIVN